MKNLQKQLIKARNQVLDCLDEIDSGIDRIECDEPTEKEIDIDKIKKSIEETNLWLQKMKEKMEKVKKIKAEMGH